MSTSHTSYATDGPIAVLTFNRQESRNAMTWAMYDALVDACDAVDADPAIRVFVLRGADDRAFVAGTDISQFRELRTAEDALAYEARLDRLIDRLEEADLVERRRDPDDRRAQRLFLTKAAAPIMEQLWKMVADMHEEALAGLSTAVRVGIIKALQTMKNNLLQAEEEDAPDTRTRRGAAANAGNG